MWPDYDDTKLSDLVDTERREPRLVEEGPTEQDFATFTLPED